MTFLKTTNTTPDLSREIPLLKEYRISRIIDCIDCIKQYPYSREKQRDCVLTLYSSTNEKSVFRGMVIPSLRSLGFIIGYEESIRPSANGSLIVESKAVDEKLHKRVVAAIIMELDRKKFGFIELLSELSKGNPVAQEQLKSALLEKICGPSIKQKIERIKHWQKLLEQTNLVMCTTVNHLEVISINEIVKQEAERDLSISKEKIESFSKYFIPAIDELRKESGVIINIPDLRERIGIKILKNEKQLLTEIQFDNLLRNNIATSYQYKISLGRSMGAEEKLFEYSGKYYRTLTVERMDGR
jgi:hypothetical protein